jgi:hypothetical protein
MSEAEKTELEQLRHEVKRLRLEAKYYKEELEELCVEAEKMAHVVVGYLRGRPGDKHPVMEQHYKVRSLVDRARHTYIFIDSMMRATK